MSIMLKIWLETLYYKNNHLPMTIKTLNPHLDIMAETILLPQHECISLKGNDQFPHLIGPMSSEDNPKFAS